MIIIIFNTVLIEDNKKVNKIPSINRKSKKQHKTVHPDFASIIFSVIKFGSLYC